MGRIVRLPEEVAAQIAAGEVVERPASVVKELVENALDAGAARIEIEIEEGGIARIAVTDDGIGMAPEDLDLAVERHATSKLRTAADLAAILTLGFRGEALPSIASVSRFSMRSRARGAPEGAELAVEGGRKGALRPAGAAEGTRVEARDLFYNTPARRKFLKSARVEAAQIADLVSRMAAAHPGVAFALRTNGRSSLDLPATGSPAERLRDILGREVASPLLPASGRSGAASVTGFAGPPTLARRNSRGMWFYLNGRNVRDKLLLRAVKDAYRGLLMTGEEPVVVLFLDVPPGDVDVNVHPAKWEVRFQKTSEVYEAIYRAVRETLERAGASHVRPTGEKAPPDQGSGFWVLGSGKGGEDRRPTPTADRPPSQSEIRNPKSEITAVREEAPLFRSVPTPPPAPGRVAQLHRTYLVRETDGGIEIADQHALHEKILYLRFLRRLEEGPLPSQRLLTPAVAEVGPDGVEAAEAHGEALERLGLRVRPFGEKTLAIEACPAILPDLPPQVILEEALAALRPAPERPPPVLGSRFGVPGSGGRGSTADDRPSGQSAIRNPQSAIPLSPPPFQGGAGGGSALPQSKIENPKSKILPASLHLALATWACKAAVKAGQALPDEEVRGLFSQGDLVLDVPYCPHGRPAVLRMTLAELERQFGRK